MATATSPVAGIPLTELQKRIWSDIEWAQRNADLQQQCAGEWVAIYERTLMAHGKDRDQVLSDAAAALQRPIEELAVWPFFDNTSLLSDSPPPPPGS
jgi:hypothetical protein